MDTMDIQRRLKELGFDPGPIDGLIGKKTKNAVWDFQKANDLFPDGFAGPRTLAVLFPNVDTSKASTLILPMDWMPDAKMDRIIFHWTAGAHVPTNFDRKHYHILIDGMGNPVKGIPSIRDNQAPPTKNYAAHTLNCNSGSVGLSLACMAGAVENPFNPGPAPMTRAQWDAGVLAGVDLCKRYRIPVTPRTVLSHAEVQDNLGIKQRGKWDYTRLAFDLSVKGARACGDKLRREIQEAMK